MEILTYVGIALVIAMVALLAYAASKPDAFRTQRSTTINAPAERIYPLIANLRQMNTWNPFVKPDPNITIEYRGPEAGKGAVHTWNGNRNVGEGSIEITEAVAYSKVDMRLLMLKPMKADNAVAFTLVPNGNATTVTWAMSGQQPFIGKLMSTFIDCDRMVGSQFDKGLASLKSIAERSGAGVGATGSATRVQTPNV
jgi:uncharacterized protein YndB with AHSA1/START domain